MERSVVENAILQLDILMADPSSAESDFQSWFENHPVVFDIMGYSRHIPHPHLTKDGNPLYIPDFLAERVDGLWDIIEIKRPDTETLKHSTKRQTFYAEMETYLSQAGQDYAKYFNDAANRDEFHAKYNVRVQEQPDSIVIAGRKHGLDMQVVHRLLSGRSPRVILQTYDHVRDRLELYRAKSFGGYENLPGLSVHLVMVLEPTASESFIFDIGSDATRNRLSAISSAAGDLTFSVHDRKGRLHQAVVPCRTDTFSTSRAVYVSVDVGGSADKAIMLAEVNGQYCVEARLSDLELTLDYPLATVLGSDLTGSRHSAMRVCEQFMYSRTMTFLEKAQLREYVFNRYERFFFDDGKRPGGLEFMGHKFMHSEGHPSFSSSCAARSTNMLQEVFDRRPVLRADEF